MERRELAQQIPPLWPQDATLLVAVSGGVDSMVLLDVLVHAGHFSKIGVAFVNHHLRPESDQEQELVATYCRHHQIAFYTADWVPSHQNIEANARAFRYTFFEQTMEKGYAYLLTAHHLQDQTETMLMKLIREGQLLASKGLVLSQPFAQGKYLVRPLLHVEKATLYAYAKTYQVPYAEDASNQSDTYMRNRIRHHLVPQLLAENPQALTHFQRVGQQIELVEQVIEEDYQLWQTRYLHKTATYWQVDLETLAELSPAKQYYFWQSVAKDSQRTFCPISQKQLEALYRLLEEKTSQWELDLANGAKLKRRYHQLFIIIEETSATHESEPMKLMIGQTYALSAQEKIGIFLPEELPEWSADYELPLRAQSEFWLRRRQAGDRIALTPKLTKKVARYLIDQKIPLEQREKGWVLENKDKNLLAFLPFTCSYLSIPKETDKIHYVLRYKYQE